MTHIDHSATQFSESGSAILDHLEHKLGACSHQLSNKLHVLPESTYKSLTSPTLLEGEKTILMLNPLRMIN